MKRLFSIAFALLDQRDDTTSVIICHRIADERRQVTEWAKEQMLAPSVTDTIYTSFDVSEVGRYVEDIDPNVGDIYRIEIL